MCGSRQNLPLAWTCWVATTRIRRRSIRTVLDVALSAKWNPFKAANAPLNAYVIVPANGDHGLRSDVVYGIGIDIVL